MIKFGRHTLKHGLFLAPMAGFTPASFRIICAKHGALWTTTEMISAKAVYYSDKKTAAIADITRDISPVSIQLFGSEPQIMAYAAKILYEIYPTVSAFDINAGCPMKKITSNGEGAALMKSLSLLGEIVNVMTKAVPVPITVKIRTGWNSSSKNAVEVAKVCQNSGAALITVHARTKEQLYSPPIDFETISEVKSALLIPVIGNGGIENATDAVYMMKITGCDGVMVGQGALGNPWIFSEISAAFEVNQNFYTPPSDEQKLECAKEHLHALIQEKGELVGVREGRSQIGKYLNGMRAAASFRSKLNACASEQDVLNLFKTHWK